MQRRDYIKTAGGIATASVIGGAGLFASTGSVAAVQSGLDIQDASAVQTDDGQVSYVEVALTHRLQWDGFDKPVAKVAYVDQIIVAPNSSTPFTATIYDGRNNPVDLEDFSEKNSSDGWGGDGEYASEDPNSYTKATGPTKAGFVNADINWKILTDGGGGGNSVESPADLNNTSIEEPTDGESNSTSITYKKTVYLYDDNGNLLGNDDGTVQSAVAEGTFTVTINNQDATTTSGGSGSSTVGT
ncbi:hypothetical protein EGH21_20545 [Halomicroarcula sp. F13]|uniref:Uncharacterized protein n=1 Tax=Haloarcula rubra TaxID=2487747 RepID=A0AAW4PVU4_9EURY|nr:hypothetical protein [Halomicroarcula rubra]MBX0325420.1 hypothetical protein [Halomicroarcula rubra]